VDRVANYEHCHKYVGHDLGVPHFRPAHDQCHQNVASNEEKQVVLDRVPILDDFSSEKRLILGKYLFILLLLCRVKLASSPEDVDRRDNEGHCDDKAESSREDLRE
jgi:hypothetical protein